MLAYLIRRVLAVIPVMAVVAIIVFLLLRLTPGDPAAVIAGDYATPNDIERIRQQLGLNEPIYTQLGIWLWSLMRGDLGISIFSELPVTRLIGQRLEPTLALTLSTMLFAIVFAVPMGVVAAWKVRTWVDRVLMLFAVLSFSLPVFWLGFLLIRVFSVGLEWLPVQGYVSFREGWVPFLSHLILPSATLGLVYMALIARITRATVLEVLAEDYIRTAHAKGLRPMNVLFGHALKNASVPIVTILGVGVALLIGGVVVTESVFAIPGLGRLTVDAILRRDYPVIQGVILVFSSAYVFVNLMVDLTYTFLDPRIRY
ncbi:MAG: ABC transporter permease [SAR324 cluster bacterium]|nr:ABC transporter permease [SAR324 cluster bacterium]